MRIYSVPLIPHNSTFSFFFIKAKYKILWDETFALNWCIPQITIYKIGPNLSYNWWRRSNKSVLYCPSNESPQSKKRGTFKLWRQV